MNNFFADEYLIEQAADFNEKVEHTLPIRQWDSVSYGLTWQLASNPRFSAHNIVGNRWVIQIESQPEIAVFYTIDEAAKVVTLTDIRRGSSFP